MFKFNENYIVKILMVKLTKFQIESKLATLIQHNDFEQLESFIQTNPEISLNLHLDKKYCGLLSWAISNKSKECFDWILAHEKFTAKKFKIVPTYELYERNYYSIINFADVNNFEEEEPDNENINPEPINNHVESDNGIEDSLDYENIMGIEKAIEMYSRAPNFPNSYYLRELVKAQAYIFPEHLVKLERFPDLYNQACVNINLDFNYLLGLFIEQLATQSKMVIKTYEKIKNNLTPKQLSVVIKKTVRKNSYEFLSWI
jgi:hypothetical protein